MRSKEVNAYTAGIKVGVKPIQGFLEKYTSQFADVQDLLGKIRKDEGQFNRYMHSLAMELDRYHDNQVEIDETEKRQYKKLERIYNQLQEAQKAAKIDTYVCHKCGRNMFACQIVCTNCGQVFDQSMPYREVCTDETAFNEIQKLSEAMQQTAQANLSHCYKQFQSIVTKMKKVTAVSKIAEKRLPVRDVGDISDSLISDISRAHLEVALVGTVKAGKSMLINALIGAEVASVDATPETSVVAKYHTTADKNFVRASFYSTVEFNKLWENVTDSPIYLKEYDRANASGEKAVYLDHEDVMEFCDSAEELQQKIMRYTKSDRSEHYYVKELEVGFCSNTFPNNVSLVDTPGLKDPVKYRSDITREYLKNVDFVLACVEASNLSSDDTIKTILEIFSNINNDPKKWLVIGTQRDKLASTHQQEKQELFLQQLEEIQHSKNFYVISAAGHVFLKKYQCGKSLDDAEEEILDGVVSKCGRNSSNDRWRLSDIIYPENAAAVYQYCGIQDLVRWLEENVFPNADRRVKEKLNRVRTKKLQLMQQRINPLLEQTMDQQRAIDQDIDQAENLQEELSQAKQGIQRLSEMMKDAIKTFNRQCNNLKCDELTLDNSYLKNEHSGAKEDDINGILEQF